MPRPSASPTWCDRRRGWPSSRSPQQRTAGEHAEDLSATPEGITYETVADGGVAGVWAQAPGPAPTSTVLYLFGGGHVITSPKSRHKFAGHLARALDARVLLLDYPLAPEHPYPQDVDAAVPGRALAARAAARRRRTASCSSGESSGGGLVLETLLAAARAGLPRPAAAYLMSPWADLTCSSRLVRRAPRRRPGVQPREPDADGGPVPRRPRPHRPAASPVLAAPETVATAWPPLLVQVGSHEVLLDDSLAVARLAALADVPVTLDVWPQMQHFFQLGVGVYPEAAAALARAGAWLRERWDAPASVREVARPREVHGHAGLVRGLDGQLVAHRPAGLDDGGDAGLGEHLEPVREREERVRRGDGAGDAVAARGPRRAWRRRRG